MSALLMSSSLEVRFHDLMAPSTNFDTTLLCSQLDRERLVKNSMCPRQNLSMLYLDSQYKDLIVPVRGEEPGPDTSHDHVQQLREVAEHQPVRLLRSWSWAARRNVHVLVLDRHEDARPG